MSGVVDGNKKDPGNTGSGFTPGGTTSQLLDGAGNAIDALPAGFVGADDIPTLPSFFEAPMAVETYTVNVEAALKFGSATRNDGILIVSGADNEVMTAAADGILVLKLAIYSEDAGRCQINVKINDVYYDGGSITPDSDAPTLSSVLEVEAGDEIKVFVSPLGSDLEPFLALQAYKSLRIVKVS